MLSQTKVRSKYQTKPTNYNDVKCVHIYIYIYTLNEFLWLTELRLFVLPFVLFLKAVYSLLRNVYFFHPILFVSTSDYSSSIKRYTIHSPLSLSLTEEKITCTGGNGNVERCVTENSIDNMSVIGRSRRTSEKDQRKNL